MKIKILVIGLLLLSKICQADTWLGVGGGSFHTCQTCGYNNFNPGLGIQKDYQDDLRLIGGVYYNSFYKASFYGGVGYQPFQYKAIKLGIIGGVVTNYDNLQIPLMVLPVLSIEGDSIGVDILGGPSVGNRSGLITANLKFKL